MGRAESTKGGERFSSGVEEVRLGSLGEGGIDDFMYRGGTGGGVNVFFSLFLSCSTLPFGSFPTFNIWREMITLAKLPK